MEKVEADRREPYMVRNEVLKSLGYRSYKEYLASDDWKAIRTAILARFPECICCLNQSQVVHHLRYCSRTLLGLLNENLAPLCHACHEKIEILDGDKTKMGYANTSLLSMARKKDSKQVWLVEFYKHRKKLPDADGKERKTVHRKLKDWIQDGKKH